MADDEYQLQADADARAADEAARLEAAESAPEPDDTPAAARLRAFEDENLGPDAVRIDGKIERGSGSPYAELSDEKKRQYAAIEKLVEAEQKLADAHAALLQADADFDAALADIEPREPADDE